MKNSSTYAFLCTETPAEARVFDAWLEEWEADQEIRDLETKDEAMEININDQRLAAARGSYDSKIETGQIRILSKRYTLNPQVIPYVAVLEEWEDGNWLVLPFSSYQTPATPGEMRTGIDLLGLGVLQAWNGRTVPADVLSKSFLFGALDEKIRGEASALFRNQLANTELPADFSALRGPAILMESDPRCDYQQESIARLRPLSAAVHAYNRLRNFDKGLIRSVFTAMTGTEGGLWRPRYGEENYALAAGEVKGQQVDVFVVQETELSVVYSPEDGITIFTFYNRNDEPDAAYDGYGIIGPGEFIGTFKNGTLRVPSEQVKGWYQIVDREGHEVRLTKK